MGREEKKENFRRMNDVRLKAINRCGAVLIAATLRTFRLPMSPCAVSKVHTGPLQDLRVLETIFLVVLFEKLRAVVFFRRQNSTVTIIYRSAPPPTPKFLTTSNEPEVIAVAARDHCRCS